MTALLNSGVRWVLYADLMLLFGLPFFRIHGASARQAAASPPRRIWLVCAALGVLGVVASIAGLVVTAATMAGVEVTAVDRATLSMIVTDTAVGMSLVVRCVALVATILGALWLGKNGRRPALALVVSGAAIALASLAWAGHAAAGEGWGGALQLAADIVHLCAAGVWVGALAALMAMVLRDLASPNSHATDDTYDALRRFAHTGSIVVMLIVASGVINTAMLVGASNLAHLPASLYGRLLMGKLAIFLAMLAFAAKNRFHLTPALGNARTPPDRTLALARLRRSIVLETGCAGVILGLVAWLGSLEPQLAS